MANHDKILKMYADGGLRTLEEWTAMGRQAKPSAAARLEINHKGRALALFAREQTQVRPRRAV